MNIIIVGCGFAGSIIAREIAENSNLPVTIIEKRSHIGGNMYDEYDDHKILVQKYGPHVVVTNEWKVIDYLSKYSELTPYTVKELSFIEGKYVQLPFNFKTVQQLVGGNKAESLLHEFRESYKGRDRVPILELMNSNSLAIQEYANLLFEKAFRTYCAKQWDLPVETLDKSIMNRVPMAMSYDERYMNKDFQYLPRKGFTSLFYNLLNHPNIRLKLNEDALKYLVLDEKNKSISYKNEKVDVLIFTGPIDELFKNKSGELPYRSLDIRYEWFDKQRCYPEAIISFPQAKGYNRKTEYKFLMEDPSLAEGTVIATEYPIAYHSNGKFPPFYPEITNETKERYSLYQKQADKFKNLFLCGRLAEFRYYNMDDCILKALSVYNDIKEKFLK